MSETPKLKRCEDVAPLLVFYACDELTSEEREQIVAHLAICDGCRAQLSEEDALQAAIDRMPQVADQFESSGVLLAQCRSELSESLDELSAPRLKKAGSLSLGACVDGAAPGLERRCSFACRCNRWDAGNSVASVNPGNGGGSAVKVYAAPRITPDTLNKMAVSGINFSRPTGKFSCSFKPSSR